jgi:hypothetical protein
VAVDVGERTVYLTVLQAGRLAESLKKTAEHVQAKKWSTRLVVSDVEVGHF